jgi:hypothetical protein
MGHDAADGVEMGDRRPSAPDAKRRDVTIEGILWLLLGAVIGMVAGFAILIRTGAIRLRRWRKTRWHR